MGVQVALAAGMGSMIQAAGHPRAGRCKPPSSLSVSFSYAPSKAKKLPSSAKARRAVDGNQGVRSDAKHRIMSNEIKLHQ